MENIMIYTMTVREAFRKGGASWDIATTEFDGKIFEAESRNGATMRLARQMIKDGLPEGAWQVVDGQGRVRFFGPSLYRLAKLTINETDKEGPRLRPHREFKEKADETGNELETASV